MTALIITLHIAAWAIWRRWMGGFGGGPRWWRIAAIPVLTAGLWFVHPAAWAVAVLWMMIFWLPGHDWTGLGPLVARYGPVGICWWAAQRWLTKPMFDRVWDFGRRRLEGFIDGPLSIAELAAGALIGAGLGWLVAAGI